MLGGLWINTDGEYIEATCDIDFNQIDKQDLIVAFCNSSQKRFDSCDYFYDQLKDKFQKVDFASTEEELESVFEEQQLSNESLLLIVDLEDTRNNKIIDYIVDHYNQLNITLVIVTKQINYKVREALTYQVVVY